MLLFQQRSFSGCADCGSAEFRANPLALQEALDPPELTRTSLWIDLTSGGLAHGGCLRQLFSFVVDIFSRSASAA